MTEGSVEQEGEGRLDGKVVLEEGEDLLRLFVPLDLHGAGLWLSVFLLLLLLLAFII